jgi:hypothetical protein
MTRAQATLAAGTGAVLGFAAVTLVALEAQEVVVLRTTAPDGTRRETRAWVADEDGASWVEAANAARPFLAHLDGHPEVELRRAGAWRRCRATAVPGPAGHARIRRLLAARYGWADGWIGALTDTSGSVAVRLDCEGT